MKFIFYQNIISIHQSSFLTNLAINHDVILFVYEDIYDSRKKQGWEVPKLANVKIIKKPTKEEVSFFFNINNTHIFSGINTYPFVYKFFKKAVISGFNVFTMLEPFRTDGFKGKLRYIKYFYLMQMYDSKIKGILATGRLGRSCYENVGFSKNKIFDWGYFVEDKLDFSKKKYEINKFRKIVFVGEISKRKNIIPLVKKILPLLSHNNQFSIIGDGVLLNKLQQLISNTQNVNYLGNLNNNEVVKLVSKHDLLILPSLFDGWGAVVNEALHTGTQVLTSESCGASVLLDGEKRGAVFSLKKNNMEAVLKKWINKRIRERE